MESKLEDRLLTVEEAAHMLGISPKTLYVWSSRGKIQKVKIGKTLRFRHSTLMKLLDDSTIEAVA